MHNKLRARDFANMNRARFLFACRDWTTSRPRSALIGKRTILALVSPSSTGRARSLAARPVCRARTLILARSIRLGAAAAKVQIFSTFCTRANNGAKILSWPPLATPQPTHCCVNQTEPSASFWPPDNDNERPETAQASSKHDGNNDYYHRRARPIDGRQWPMSRAALTKALVLSNSDLSNKRPLLLNALAPNRTPAGRLASEQSAGRRRPQQLALAGTIGVECSGKLAAGWADAAAERALSERPPPAQASSAPPTEPRTADR